MTRRWPRWTGLAALVSFPLAVTALGLAAERADIFPLLRFAVQRTESRLPSTLAVDTRAVVSGLPILSVYLAPDDLDFLLANKMAHGRDYERRASVSFFDQGRLLFTGAAGIRVHGGGSRITSPRQGFRLFFRRRYGSTQMGRDVLFGPASQPLQRLVVHNDLRTDRDKTPWRLVNPLGYDVARRVGAVTPDTLPARFFLNGEDYGLFVLTEHFDDEYFASHMPGRRITMELADMEALRARLDRMYPLTLEKARAEIDMDNLVSWFISAIFLATRDAYQGPGQFLDEASGRWFWVTWDVDQSLRNWDHESFQYLLNVPGERERGRRRSEPRPFLLGRLIAEDPAFRDYLAERVDTMLNHQLTRSFLEERRSHYEEIAARFGIEEADYRRRIRQFLSLRSAFVRQITEQWLNTSQSVRVAARREGGGGLEVDGYAKDGPFEGWYFPGRTVRLRVPDGRPVRWYVNGAPVEISTELPVRADGPLEVVAASPEAPAPAFPAPPAAVPAPSPAARSALGPSPAAPRAAGWRRIPGSSEVQPFEMAATETTVAQFRAFARATGTLMPRQPRWSAEDHPVVNLTWAEAGAYCSWAGGRLPSEAEWELAARAGGRGQYPWGDVYDPSLANGLGLQGADDRPYTAPVASFPPNAYGLYDTIGNVWEWTSGTTRAGAPPGAPADYLRTVRGGSWGNRRENLRLQIRVGLPANGRHNLYVGIRCAR